MDEYRRTGLILFLSVLSLLTYAAAFFVPNFDQADPEPYWGTTVFILGLVYCWLLPITFAWWANVLFWIALVCRARIGRAWAFTAGLLASSLLVFDVNGKLVCLPYYLWMGSMFLYAFACHLILRDEKSQFRKLLEERPDKIWTPNSPSGTQKL